MADKGPALVKQRNVVVDNAIFREKVRQEKRHSHINENFDFNPKNLIAVTDKPTKAFDIGDSTTNADFKMKLSSLTTMPKQKFSYPQTEAQEIGWDMDVEYATHVTKNPIGKKNCPETQYADNFIIFQGRSPFKAVKPVAAEAPKK